MKSTSFTLHTLFALSCAFVIGSKSFAEPPNLGQLKQTLSHYHDSGDYDRELAQVVHKAQRFMDAVIQKNEHATHPKKLALVLDIDETSLSNYPLMASHAFCASLKDYEAWQQTSKAPAIQPTLALYQDAIQHHVDVFFITGRPPITQKATEKNLKQAGFLTWSKVYYRPQDDHAPSVIPFKTNTRQAIESQGYTIIASIGDQQSDIDGGHALKGFKLPNPNYYIP